MTKSMKWRKLGKVISPEGIKRSWMATHAMDPTVDHLEGSLFVYFCGRNNKINHL